MATAERAEGTPQTQQGQLMRRLVLAHLRQEGVAAAQDGHPDWAEAYFRRALALDGDDADLWVLLGSVVQDNAIRLACARQALHLAPEDPQARALLEQVSQSPPAQPDFRLPTPRLRPQPGRGRPSPPAKKREPALRPVTAGADRTPTRPFPIAMPIRNKTATVGPRWEIRPADWLASLAAGSAWPRLLATTVLLLLLLLDGGLIAAYGRKYQDRIYPGVRIGQMDAGGLSRAQAEQLLQEQLAPTLDQAILLSYGDQSWVFSAAELGLHYQVAEAGEQAQALGRDRWWERQRIALQGADVPLIATVQAHRLQAAVEAVADALDQAPVPPSTTWQQAGWEILPGQDGRHVLQEEARQRLLDTIAALVQGAEVPPGMMVVVDLPVVTDSASLPLDVVDGLRGQLNRIGQPLTLQCEELSWTVGPAEIAAWTRVELSSSPGHATIEIDRPALRTFLTGLAPQVARPVTRPRIEVNEAGRVTTFRTGQAGRRLDLGEAVRQVVQVLRSRIQGEDIATVDLPSEVIPPGDDALMKELGVLEWIGEGTSTFVGSSPARSNNILIGGQELHGRLIAPDDIFSLNAALDPITWEKGYQLSPIIIGGGVTMGLGGGLCQVATTLYRAALYTGLEIVERHPHLWRVEWYEQDAPPGFDATIALGGPDLKFRNNTGHYLLIQVTTRLDRGRQTIQFYGTSPGWEVSVDNVAISNGGHDVSYVRTVRKDGEILRQETIYSHYQ